MNHPHVLLYYIKPFVTFLFLHCYLSHEFKVRCIDCRLRFYFSRLEKKIYEYMIIYIRLISYNTVKNLKNQ